MIAHLLTPFAFAYGLAPHVARADVAVDDDDEDTLTPCRHTGVIGHDGCRFGTWGANLREPYLFVDFGLTLRHFAPVAMPIVAARIGGAATMSSGAVAGGGTGTGGSRDQTLEFDERLGVGIGHGLYLALDLELGNFMWSRGDDGRDVMLAASGAFGLRIGLGPIALSAEIAGGGMAYSWPSSTSFATAPLVEARGRAELWISPWITIGAVGGTSVLRRDEYLVGGFVGFHTHAYAGDR